MQPIDLEVGRQFDLAIKSIIPFRDSFILNTAKGRKLLKKLDMSPERILFIHGAKEHLFNNNFINVDRYTCTYEGKPCLVTDQGCFTLTDFIEGDECNFDSNTDLSLAVKTLAQLHAASKGYIPPQGAFKKDELGKLPVTYKKRLDEIKRAKKMAGKGKSKFDYLVLEYADYYYSQGSEALQIVLKPEYEMLVNEARKLGSFCHHDYTHHNILINHGCAVVSNFNFCCNELKVYDIANLIRRKARKCNWDTDEVLKIIDVYSKYESLTKDELHVMLSILQFPQKFWRVVNKYYNSRRSWSENVYAVKMMEVIEELPHHGKFLEKYRCLF